MDRVLLLTAGNSYLIVQAVVSVVPPRDTVDEPFSQASLAFFLVSLIVPDTVIPFVVHAQVKSFLQEVS